MDKLKIGYFADGLWSHNTFNLFKKDEKIEIMFICVRYDTQDDILKQMAIDNDIDYLKHMNVNSDDFLEKIKKYDCDLFVSMSFNQIFKNRIINMPKLKTINCHAGKLPFYRGRNILNWVLINDEKEFGITVHYVDQGIDTGDIILQKSYPITDEDDYGSLLAVAHVECANVLYDAVRLIREGKAKAIKQSDIHPVGFYCGRRQVGDEQISWNRTSREIFNFVRALSAPGPVARTNINGVEMKINEVEMIKNAMKYKGIIGQIVGKNNEDIIVKTKDTTIRICSYFCDGNLKIGDRFE